MKHLIDEYTAVARSVNIDGRTICVQLSDGREIRFPAEKNRRLAKASLIQLTNVKLICGGTGLHWPELDEDLSIQGILSGRLGSA